MTIPNKICLTKKFAKKRTEKFNITFFTKFGIEPIFTIWKNVNLPLIYPHKI